MTNLSTPGIRRSNGDSPRGVLTEQDLCIIRANFLIGQGLGDCHNVHGRGQNTLLSQEKSRLLVFDHPLFQLLQELGGFLQQQVGFLIERYSL